MSGRVCTPEQPGESGVVWLVGACLLLWRQAARNVHKRPVVIFEGSECSDLRSHRRRARRSLIETRWLILSRAQREQAAARPTTGNEKGTHSEDRRAVRRVRQLPPLPGHRGAKEREDAHRLPACDLASSLWRESHSEVRRAFLAPQRKDNSLPDAAAEPRVPDGESFSCRLRITHLSKVADCCQYARTRLLGPLCARVPFSPRRTGISRSSRRRRCISSAQPVSARGVAGRRSGRCLLRCRSASRPCRLAPGHPKGAERISSPSGA